MRNIDAKFEPYVAINDIRDEDYSRFILKYECIVHKVLALKNKKKYP